MAKLGWGLGIFLAILGLVALWVINPEPSAEVQSEINAVPSVRKETSEFNPSSSEKEIAVEEKWNALTLGIQRLSDKDQKGLEALYSESKETIHKYESETIELLKQRLPSLLTLKPNSLGLKQGFFVINSWIRFSNHPTQIFHALVDIEPVKSNSPVDSHHPAMTSEGVHERMESQALRELRKKMAGERKLASDERSALIKRLEERGREHKSLNLILENVQLLKTLGEKSAIDTILERLSPRDRKLIQDFLAKQ